MTLSEADIIRIRQTNPAAIDPAMRDDMPVSWYRRDDGNYQIISRYGDSVWQYPQSRFAAGKQASDARMDFDTIPPAFRPALKAILRRWDVEVRPRGASLTNLFYRSKTFLAYLERLQVTCLSQVTAMHCASYAAHCRSLTSLDGKPLSRYALANRFVAVEALQRWALGTPYAFLPPWPESSAAHLAGLTGQGPRRAATLVIPDDILKSLFRAAGDCVQRAEHLFEAYSAVESERARLEREGLRNGSVDRPIRTLIRARGFRDKRNFNAAYAELLPAAAIVILTLSGIRIHELCYLRSRPELGGKCWYATENEDGDQTYWMVSRSDKTSEGETEWMIPPLATEALDVVTRVARPLQASLEKQLAADPESIELNARAGDRRKIFLGRPCKQGTDIVGLSSERIAILINTFANAHDIPWHFTPHQFRRTFATCVAKSEFGDLRYLRQHFKHWSLDMTALYALNEKQDADLYDEVMTAVIDEKLEIVTHWLDDETLLSGGGAEPIRVFRASHEPLRTYESRREMAARISDLVHIRATGSAWCTADDGGCAGRSVVENTRCGDCENAVIDSRNLKRWAGIYAQQLELRDIEDLGPAAKTRIDRDIARCEQVLQDLGALEAVQTTAGIFESST